MNESVRMVVVLAVIAMVSGGLLAVVYDWTSAIIAENQLREMESSVFEVLPGAARIELLDTAPSTLVQDDPETAREVEQTTTQIFVGYDEQDQAIGYAFVGEGAGYGGAVRVLVGVDGESGKIIKLVVLNHAETPGLGSKIEEASFREQFAGKTLDDPIALGKDINAVSGATVSSQAVVNAVRRGFEDASAAFERSR